jgi:hypothetical protein
MDEVERVRVRRFEWERLMLSSFLPWATRSVLLALAVYMSEDGGNARPGLRNLETVTGLSQRSLSRHLGTAVEEGYLGLVYRGGYRGGRGEIRTVRASRYAATVPKGIFDTASDILLRPPWRRAIEPATDGTFTPGGSPGGGLGQPNEPAIGVNEPANGCNEPDTGDALSRSGYHVIGDHVLPEDQLSASGPSGSQKVFGRHHEYDEDPWNLGYCRCGLPRHNEMAHRRAS